VIIRNAYPVNDEKEAARRSILGNISRTGPPLHSFGKFEKIVATIVGVFRGFEWQEVG
jgi:hypothetical protein